MLLLLRLLRHRRARRRRRLQMPLPAAATAPPPPPGSSCPRCRGVISIWRQQQQYLGRARVDGGVAGHCVWEVERPRARVAVAGVDGARHLVVRQPRVAGMRAARDVALLACVVWQGGGGAGVGGETVEPVGLPARQPRLLAPQTDRRCRRRAAASRYDASPTLTLAVDAGLQHSKGGTCASTRVAGGSVFSGGGPDAEST